MPYTNKKGTDQHGYPHPGSLIIVSVIHCLGGIIPRPIVVISNSNNNLKRDSGYTASNVSKQQTGFV